MRAAGLHDMIFRKSKGIPTENAVPEAGAAAVVILPGTDNIRGLFPEPPFLADGRISLGPLSLPDAESIRRMTQQEEVYRYLPTLLFEKQYSEPEDVIARLYSELTDSLILGIYTEERFCGLLEVYSYKALLHKVSAGYRLLREEWGKGSATEALGLMIDELPGRRSIRLIMASTMLRNHASAQVLRKNGFTLALHAVKEDWGFPEATAADKWIRWAALPAKSKA